VKACYFALGLLCLGKMSVACATKTSPLCCYCGQVCQKYYVKISFHGSKFYGCMRGADDFERNSNLRQFLPKKLMKVSQGDLGSKEHTCSECGDTMPCKYVKVCLPEGRQYFCWADHCQRVLSEKIIRSMAEGYFDENA
jgi:hypothetical protein